MNYNPPKPFPNTLPGQIFNDAAEEYMAFTFTLPKEKEVNSGKFNLNFIQAIGTTREHNISVNISPCPGDFRPRAVGSSDPFLTTYCRKVYNTSGSVRGNTNHEGPNSHVRCKVPADKKLYINVSLWEMYNLEDTATPERVRETYSIFNSFEACSNNYCGAGYSVSN